MSIDLQVLEHVGYGHRRQFYKRQHAARFRFHHWIYVVPCESEPAGGLRELLDRMAAVPGYDISQTGIAFYLPKRPTSTTYLVRLGEIPNAMLLLCRVARVVEGYWERQRQIRVGCAFLRRIPF